jgi:phosphohistidine phosphatase SixA
MGREDSFRDDPNRHGPACEEGGDSRLGRGGGGDGIRGGVEAMELYLVRHARAFERDAAAWPDDSKRPLTHGGRVRFMRLARHLRRVMPPVDLLESSRFTRAWQTALLLQAGADWPGPTRFEALEGEGTEVFESMRRALAVMQGIDRVAWVGHEPQLGRFASFLLTGDPDRVAVDFRKGAVMQLLLDRHARAPARLGWMLTPRLAKRRKS